ncbi:MAG: pyrroline-5-carboxylate reductase [Actinomycetes bacterium]|jgi:pyrroline-5-carboxylate reductase|nr:pyrroline-5-carboxylate reductase [Actinomycetes bacterium]
MSALLHKLLIVGGGNMGEALLSGFLASELVQPAQVTVIETNTERRAYLSETYRVDVAADFTGITLRTGDVCLMAVKPQVVPAVLPKIRLHAADALLISIAAGIPLMALEDELSERAAVIRVMPNTPAMVRCGMSLISGGCNATPEHLRLAVKLFESVGRAAVIPEELQNAGAAVSGCGPAYFGLVVSALIRAGLTRGLPRALAGELAVQTAYGTAMLLRESGQHPESLIDAVTSPGGTTIAALNQLEDAGLRAAFTAAIEAAVERAEELEDDFYPDDEDDDDDFEIELDDDDEDDTDE